MSQTRCTLAAVVCTAAFAVSCLAQTNPTFTNVVSKSGPIPVNMYAVDLNGDGFPDMVQDTAASPNGFTVSLANGDGTYKAPVTYMLPSGTAPAPIATGDFNNDGKADLAIQLTGTNQIAVYLGNGDGTFQAPKTSTIALPGGQVFASAPLVTADYNKDGKLDLVAVGAAGSQQTVYVVEGDGTGGFATPQMILNPPAGSSVGNLAIGDFDDDAKADVALTVTTPCSGSTSICNTTVHALYGNGAFGFTDTTPYSTNALFIMSAGDANSDGVTDLIGYTQSMQQMVVLYGAYGRTFAGYFWNIPNVAAGAQFANGFAGPFALADFNGDGYMDIVGYMSNPVRGGWDYELEIFLGTANKGQYTTYNSFVPDSSLPANPFGTPPVAADENGDAIPDVVISQTPTASGNSTAPSTLVTALNTTTGGNWGGCAYPKAPEGIHLCSPASTTVTGPGQTVTASATSFGQLRKMELWINGQKLEEEYHTWGHHATLTWVANLTSGTYNATLFAVDVDNRLQRYDFAFTVNQTVPCNEPTSPGVNICSPAAGSTVSSPLQVSAAAYFTGNLARMELWVDGVKYYTETTSPYLNTTVNVPAGNHQFAVYAVNTAGTKWLKIVNATVGSCAAPSSPGVNVCSPAQGSTVASPVAVSAAANLPGTLARMEVWVDSVKYYTETTSTSFSTSINAPAGYHQFGIYAVNTAGAKYLTVVGATVK